MATYTTFKNHFVEFPMGEWFEDVTIDDREVVTFALVGGHNTLLLRAKGRLYGEVSDYTGTFTREGVTWDMECNGVTAREVYTRQIQP